MMCALLRSSGGIALCLALLSAAFGENPPPPAAAPPNAAATPAPASAAAPPTPSPATDEAWEGEAEATGKKPASPATGDAAAKDANGPELRSSDVIAKVIKDNRQQFRACYDQALAKQADLPAGTLTIHLVLDPLGNVKLAEVNESRSTLKTPNVSDCALAAAKKLKFPASSRGMETTVNYPFDFKR